MYRRELISLLEQEPLTVHEIAHLMGCPVSEVIDALEHLRKSLRHREQRMEVEPARCRKCGFTFSAEKLSRPSRCPRCHGRWITQPRIRIVRPNGG